MSVDLTGLCLYMLHCALSSIDLQPTNKYKTLNLQISASPKNTFFASFQLIFHSYFSFFTFFAFGVCNSQTLVEIYNNLRLMQYVNVHVKARLSNRKSGQSRSIKVHSVHTLLS